MPTRSKRIFAFGPFQVDEAKRLLLRDGQEVRLLRNGKPTRLSAKAFDLLLLLIEGRGGPLLKEDVSGELWGKGDHQNNVYKTVVELRKALDDDPKEQRIIKTVSNEGYRFIADVRESEAEAENDFTPPIIVDVRQPDAEPESFTTPPNPRKWSLPVLVVALALFVIGIALFLWLSPREPGSIQSLSPGGRGTPEMPSCLKITIPEGNLIRTDRHLVRVTGTIPANTHAWLFVELKGSTFGWFPQRVDKRTRDGWEYNAHFGEIGETGEFEAVALAVDTDTHLKLEKGPNEHAGGLENLPDAVAGCGSEFTTVTKSQGPPLPILVVVLPLIVIFGIALFLWRKRAQSASPAVR
jgi:DNA-binding winged helix-turn-helix (wHTH) protein